MKIARPSLAGMGKKGITSHAMTHAELVTQLARTGFEFPSYTNLATDTALYPLSPALRYGFKLTAAPGTKQGTLSIQSAQTSGISRDTFHRVVLSSGGEASYHPNSRTGPTLQPSIDGSLQFPEVLSQGIAVPKGKNDQILLATPNPRGNLLDVLKRSAGGKVRASSYELVGSALREIGSPEAVRLRLENVFRPQGSGISRVSPIDEWSRAVPAATVPKPVVPQVAPPVARHPVDAVPAKQLAQKTAEERMREGLQALTERSAADRAAGVAATNTKAAHQRTKALAKFTEAGGTLTETAPEKLRFSSDDIVPPGFWNESNEPLYLLTPAQIRSLPKGATVVRVTGEKVIKGFDSLDSDLRDGMTYFGYLEHNLSPLQRLLMTKRA